MYENLITDLRYPSRCDVDKDDIPPIVVGMMPTAADALEALLSTSLNNAPKVENIYETLRKEYLK